MATANCPVLNPIQGQFMIVDYRGFELIRMGTIKLEGVYVGCDSKIEISAAVKLALRQRLDLH